MLCHATPSALASMPLFTDVHAGSAPWPPTAYLFAFIASPWPQCANQFGTCIGHSHFPRKSFPSRTTPLSNASPLSILIYPPQCLKQSRYCLLLFLLFLHQPCLRQRSGISAWSGSHFSILSRTGLKLFEPASKEMSASEAISS